MTTERKYQKVTERTKEEIPNSNKEYKRSREVLKRLNTMNKLVCFSVFILEKIFGPF